MSWRTTLSDLVSTSGRETVHDEEILNVLRTSDDIAMGTSAIATEVGMSGEGVKQRLRSLVDDDRVRSQEIGQTLIWDLHPNERKQIVPPEIDRLVHAADRVRGLFDLHRRLGVYAILAGFALIFAALSAIVTTAPTSVEGMVSQLLAVGYSLVAAGGIVWAFGGGLQLGTVVAERVLYRELANGRSVPSTVEADEAQQRGQIEPRFLVGLVVLFFAGPALVSAAGDIHAALSAFDSIPPFYAVLLALLFLMGLCAAILGIE